MEAWDGELLNSEFLHGEACLIQIRRKAQGRMIVMRPVELNPMVFLWTGCYHFLNLTAFPSPVVRDHLKLFEHGCFTVLDVFP